MVPEDVSHLCVCWTCHIWSLRLWNQHHHWIHIEKWFPKMDHTCVCQICHIRSLWSQTHHHHWIHVKKWFPKMMRTPWGLHGDSMGLHKTLKGLSWLLSRLCKVHEESMRSPWECVGDCKIQQKCWNFLDLHWLSDLWGRYSSQWSKSTFCCYMKTYCGLSLVYGTGRIGWSPRLMSHPIDLSPFSFSLFLIKIILMSVFCMRISLTHWNKSKVPAILWRGLADWAHFFTAIIIYFQEVFIARVGHVKQVESGDRKPCPHCI